MSSDSSRPQRPMAVAASAVRMSSRGERSLAAHVRSARYPADESNTDPFLRGRAAPRNSPIRMLRLVQVIDVTGLGKTKIYELQAEGNFPMRVKITAHSVAWIEEEVQAWLARRIEASTPLSTT